MGYNKSSFPYIRDEKEEMFTVKESAHAFKSISPSKKHNPKEDTLERRTRAERSPPFNRTVLQNTSWSNDEHMDKLEEFLQQDRQNRTILIENLNRNMENIQMQLQSP